jgi:hypothetical protein
MGGKSMPLGWLIPSKTVTEPTCNYTHSTQIYARTAPALGEGLHRHAGASQPTTKAATQAQQHPRASWKKNLLAAAGSLQISCSRMRATNPWPEPKPEPNLVPGLEPRSNNVLALEQQVRL